MDGLIIMTVIGSYCLTLHAHLPWVLNHGVWPHGMDWVNEAAAETYVPLLMELYGVCFHVYGMSGRGM